jgi:prepilin-type N-terminal cleavage/methylation domain-containing protein
MLDSLYPIPKTLAPRATRAGFTLIETLIVIAISAMLSAIAIGYSSVGRNQIALSVEAAKVSQIILQAESLSIATYGNATNACGYGVSFNFKAQTYSLFAYTPQGVPSCPAVGTIKNIAPGDVQMYTQGTWNIHVANGVTLSSGVNNDGVATVMFYPPEPQTFISENKDNDLFTNQNSKVYLGTVDGTAARVITVSSAGQVSF